MKRKCLFLSIVICLHMLIKRPLLANFGYSYRSRLSFGLVPPLLDLLVLVNLNILSCRLFSYCHVYFSLTLCFLTFDLKQGESWELFSSV
jgi:hypothetical protein